MFIIKWGLLRVFLNIIGLFVMSVLATEMGVVRGFIIKMGLLPCLL